MEKIILFQKYVGYEISIWNDEDKTEGRPLLIGVKEDVGKVIAQWQATGQDKVYEDHPMDDARILFRRISDMSRPELERLFKLCHRQSIQDHYGDQTPSNDALISAVGMVFEENVMMDYEQAISINTYLRSINVVPKFSMETELMEAGVGQWYKDERSS